MRKFLHGAAVALIFSLPAAMPGGALAQTALTPLSPQDGSGASTVPNEAVPSPAVPAPYYGSFAVEVGKGKLIKLPAPVANLFVADPGTASVRPASPDSMFVFGKKSGETDIVGTDQNGNRIAQFTVSVNPSSYPNDRIQGQAQNLAPGSNVSVDTETNGTILRGTVQTAAQADALVSQAKAVATGTVTNDLTVTEPVQVELKVRIASMSRSTTRELGIDWGSVGADGISIGKFAIGGLSTASAASSLGTIAAGGAAVVFPGGTFEGVIDALAQDDLAHVLAEPTLTTLSGTQANFQVGGQFPIPVSSSGTGNNSSVTVTFKDFGVLLSFIPTVFSDGRIALQVAPSISSLSAANSATVSTGGSEVLAVPSLNITSASTTVILGSGQGMAIAGLLEDTTNQVDNGLPYLSEVPLLGALFRGDAFQREQQEVVITVTPYIVKPVDNPNSLASPDDGWSPPNDLQRILLLRNNGTTTASTSIPGDAGFMVQ
jgi:pilus assembly protein CpaC